MYTFRSPKTLVDKIDDFFDLIQHRIWGKIKEKAESQNAKDEERAKQREATERFLQETALFSYLSQNRDNLISDERELLSILYSKFSAEYSLPDHCKPEFDSNIEERISNAIQRYDLDTDSPGKYKPIKKTLTQRIYDFFKEDVDVLDWDRQLTKKHLN